MFWKSDSNCQILGFHLKRLVSHPANSRSGSARWVWLALSVCLMALAGLFLYPALESITRSEPISTPAPAEQPAAVEQRVAPVQPIPEPVQSADAPVETMGRTITRAQPIRTVAPSVP